jgi:hypothetical protein
MQKGARRLEKLGKFDGILGFISTELRGAKSLYYKAGAEARIILGAGDGLKPI